MRSDSQEKEAVSESKELRNNGKIEKFQIKLTLNRNEINHLIESKKSKNSIPLRNSEPKIKNGSTYTVGDLDPDEEKSRFLSSLHKPNSSHISKKVKNNSREVNPLKFRGESREGGDLTHQNGPHPSLSPESPSKNINCTTVSQTKSGKKIKLKLNKARKVSKNDDYNQFSDDKLNPFNELNLDFNAIHGRISNSEVFKRRQSSVPP